MGELLILFFERHQSSPGMTKQAIYLELPCAKVASSFGNRLRLDGFLRPAPHKSDSSRIFWEHGQTSDGVMLFDFSSGERRSERGDDSGNRRTPSRLSRHSAREPGTANYFSLVLRP